MINLHWIRFEFSPTYFSGIDSLLEILTVIVSILIAYYSYRCYKFSGHEKYKHFSWAFTAISFAFIFKILTNVTIYYHVLETVNLGRVQLHYLSLKASHLIYILGYFLYRTLMFFGLFGIWSGIEKVSTKKLVILLAWFIFLVNFLSHYAYFFFNVTVFLILLFITHAYCLNAKKVCTPTSKIVTASFALLALSQMFFILEWLNLQFYVVGTVIQTFAFILLLYTYFLVLKK